MLSSGPSGSNVGPGCARLRKGCSVDNACRKFNRT
jgi:hypothetical protein